VRGRCPGGRVTDPADKSREGRTMVSAGAPATTMRARSPRQVEAALPSQGLCAARDPAAPPTSPPRARRRRRRRGRAIEIVEVVWGAERPAAVLHPRPLSHGGRGEERRMSWRAAAGDGTPFPDPSPAGGGREAERREASSVEVRCGSRKARSPAEAWQRHAAHGATKPDAEPARTSTAALRSTRCRCRGRYTHPGWRSAARRPRHRPLERLAAGDQAHAAGALVDDRRAHRLGRSFSPEAPPELISPARPM
jgi:hypothetical protein